MKRNLVKRKQPEQQPLHFEGERFRCNLCGFVAETPPGCASCDQEIAARERVPFGKQRQSFEFLVDAKLPLSEGKPKGVQRRLLVRPARQLIRKPDPEKSVAQRQEERRHILIRKPPEVVKIEPPKRKLLRRMS